jgi:hypothetical protein
LKCLWERDIHVMVSLTEFFPSDMVGESLNRHLYFRIFVVMVIILSRPSLILVVITHPRRQLPKRFRCFTLLAFLRSQVNFPHLVLLDLSYCEDMTCLWENDANIQVMSFFLC